MTPLTTRFFSFVDVLHQSAVEHMPNTQPQEAIAALVTQLREGFGKDSNAKVGEVDDALRRFFRTPAAHIVAVNNLDYSQFVNVLCVLGVNMPLCDIMGSFSTMGAKVYGRLWLALLDVADIANPDDVRSESARGYIHSQMKSEQQPVVSHTSSTSIPSAMFPGVGQLEGIMGTVMNAFPGLHTGFGIDIHSLCTRLLFEIDTG
jgi:hypothetical protein